jgi:type I restriction-modification system DNA methylase subunit
VGLSAMATTQQVVENDYNLSPSRYVAGVSNGEAMTLEEAVAELKQAETERAKADDELWGILAELGVG